MGGVLSPMGRPPGPGPTPLRILYNRISGDPRLRPVFHAPKEAAPSKTAKNWYPAPSNEQYLPSNEWRQISGERRGSVLQEQIQSRTRGHSAMLALSPSHHCRTVLTLIAAGLMCECCQSLQCENHCHRLTRAS